MNGKAQNDSDLAGTQDSYTLADTIGFVGVGPINGTLARFAVNDRRSH
jgi:hypothetical protein